MSYWAELMLLWSGQALVLVGLLLAAARSLKKSSAAERHSLWLACLLVIAVLPAANVFIRSYAGNLPLAEPVRRVTSLPEVVSLPPLEHSALAPPRPPPEPSVPQQASPPQSSGPSQATVAPAHCAPGPRQA